MRIKNDFVSKNQNKNRRFRIGLHRFDPLESFARIGSYDIDSTLSKAACGCAFISRNKFAVQLEICKLQSTLNETVRTHVDLFRELSAIFFVFENVQVQIGYSPVRIRRDKRRTKHSNQ